MRISGAVLESVKPGEPLEAVKWSTLKLHFNGVHPARWDHDLGFVKEMSSTLLRQVVADGGTVPSTTVSIVGMMSPEFYGTRVGESSKQYLSAVEEAEESEKFARLRARSHEAAIFQVENEDADWAKKVLQTPSDFSPAETAIASFLTRGEQLPAIFSP